MKIKTTMKLSQTNTQQPKVLGNSSIIEIKSVTIQKRLTNNPRL